MAPPLSTSSQSNMPIKSWIGTLARRCSLRTWKGEVKISVYSSFSSERLPSLSAAVNTSVSTLSNLSRNSSKASESFCSCACRTSSMLSLTTPVITLRSAHEDKIVNITHTGFAHGKNSKIGAMSCQYWRFMIPNSVNRESRTVPNRALVSKGMSCASGIMALPIKFVVSRAEAYKATIVSTSTQNMLCKAFMMPTARWYSGRTAFTSLRSRNIRIKRKILTSIIIWPKPPLKPSRPP
mmetsp:Transcript_117688/g.293427  ORF Transcript_117688/g.293427 Transcript_117688/m.293427 type:complete len:238 (+) Transcript_117688:575-1288(+)